MKKLALSRLRNTLKVTQVQWKCWDSNPDLCESKAQAPPLHGSQDSSTHRLGAPFQSRGPVSTLRPALGAEPRMCQKELVTVAVTQGPETKQGLLLPLKLGLHTDKTRGETGRGSKPVPVPQPTALWKEAQLLSVLLLTPGSPGPSTH